MLYDHAMRLLAFSAHDAEDIDPNRSGAILARRTLPRALELVREAGAHLATAPVLIPSDPGHADRVGMPVRHRGVVLGYLVCTVAPERPLGEDGARALVAAADDLRPLLHDRALERRRRDHAVRAAVTELLHADQDVRRNAATTLLEAGLPTPVSGHRILALAPPAGVAAEDALAEVTSPPARVGAVVDDLVVLVTPAPADRERNLSRVRALLPAGARGGVGGARPDLTELAGSYDEARIALDATARDPERYGGLAAWSDLGVDRLLLRMPLDTLGPGDLPVAVRRLLEAPGGPDLARTVEAYFEHGADAQATARALVIHRSTLYYRLDRASSLSGVDVREGSLRHELHCGLRVATLAGLRRAED